MKLIHWVFLGGAVASLGMVIAYSSSLPPGPFDLTGLNGLRPTETVFPEAGWTRMTFRQPMGEVQKVLDRQLHQASGWEGGGSVPLGYLWYHRSNWRDPVPSFLSQVGIRSAFIELQPSEVGRGSILTLRHCDGLVILP